MKVDVVPSAAALRQGVRLSGLSSSWASGLVHASGFLKPEGRLAMVLPAESSDGPLCGTSAALASQSL